MAVCLIALILISFSTVAVESKAYVALRRLLKKFGAALPKSTDVSRAEARRGSLCRATPFDAFQINTAAKQIVTEIMRFSRE
jgi:hypothetical protein